MQTDAKISAKDRRWFGDAPPLPTNTLPLTGPGRGARTEAAQPALGRDVFPSRGGGRARLLAAPFLGMARRIAAWWDREMAADFQWMEW